jgi:HSP20 family protein
MVTRLEWVNGGRRGSAWAEMDRLFGRVLAGNTSTIDRSLPVAVWEDNDHAYVELELPGVNKEDLDITVEQRRLTIGAERKAPEGERRYWCNERRYGRFERAFQLPEVVDTESIKADLVAGVLTLTLSKKAAAQPRKIEIQSN